MRSLGFELVEISCSLLHISVVSVSVVIIIIFMLDFEEISFGHRDPSSHKYYSLLNECESPTMDMLLSAGESLSFQEMLDVDIKSEIDTVLGGHGDFNAFAFTELPTLELEDEPADLNAWFSGGVHSSVGGHSVSGTSSSAFNMDFMGGEPAAMMVNPNSVMPLTAVAAAAAAARSQDSRSSPSPPHVREPKKPTVVVADKRPIGKTIKVAAAAAARPAALHSDSGRAASVLNIRNAIQRQLGGTPVRAPAQPRKQQQHARYTEEEKAYPKPAYSYSCLIAMALKNSRTGSLPVSEIYNFMCEHFPYFKTAPTGWKNSVRHNLSLNKCFEKIEKPALTGAQRKGCLWAMNPSKISKMDDEVQKWSRKDPSAIRKAMVNPEQLESLERGELKYSCSGDDAYGDGEESEEASDVEVELEHSPAPPPLDEEDDEEELGLDVEVYDNDTDTEQNLLQVEMALAERELLEYEDRAGKKRSRSILEMDDDHRLYELQTGRRKAAYVLMD